MRTTRPTLRLLTAALALASAPLFAQSHSTTFSQTVFFGDSLTDGGYFRPMLPINAQPVTGQFTTNPGMVWSQYLADYYGSSAQTGWLQTPTGVKPDAGNNYAAGGAWNGRDMTGQLGPIPSLTSQIRNYLTKTGGKADANALYTVWGGANDLFGAVAQPANAQTVVGGAVTAQVANVAALQGAGARYILVPTVPDLGVTPAFLAQGPANAAQGSALSKSYNDALFAALKSQKLRVIPLDTFNLLREISTNPAAYGFRNVTGTACQPQISAQSFSCMPSTLVSPDAPYTYAFADGVHPTTAAHAIISQYVTSVLEAPRANAILPQSAANVGTHRADMVGAQIAGRGNAEGGRVWGDVRIDNQRYERGGAGDGFDGGGATLTVGYDRTAGAFVYGGYLGMGRQNIDYGARRGGFKQKDIGLGGYVGWRSGNAWVDGQLGYSKLAYDVKRVVPLGPAMRAHTGSPGGRNLQIGVQGGWDFHHGQLAHGPVASFLLQKIRVDGYTESGAGQATALKFGDQRFDSKQVSLGWQLRMTGERRFHPYARFTLDRELGDRPGEATAQLTSMPDTVPYAVPGLQFDDKFATLAFGMRGEVFGMDLQTGTTTTLGMQGGKHTSFNLGLAKRF